MILNVLPYKESYSNGEAGAIALCVKDIHTNSKYRSHDIVVSGTGAENPLTENFRYLSFTKRFFQRKSAAYIERVCKYALSNSVELVEIHNRPNWLMAISKLIDVKLSIYFHNDPLEIKGSKSLKQRLALLKTASSIYCVSEYIKNRFLKDLENYPELTKKVYVAYNMCPKPEKVEIFNKQNLIIFVGRVTKEKGVIELIKSLKYFLPENPSWKLLMIGAPSNVYFGDKSSKFITQARRQFPTQVIYKPRTEYHEVQEWFKAASIAVLPSKWEEPFGRTVLEAINNGCALVTSNKGGIPEIVHDAGIMLDKITPQNIGENIRSLIEDRNLMIDLQNRALKRAAEFAKLDSIGLIDRVRDEILSEVREHAA